MKFHLERWLQRGIWFQLMAIATIILGIAVLGGLTAWAFSGAFSNPAEAVWWAFLRMTDPGYLGDDEGALLRTVSTVITIAGYVLFMGSLIAILTQWLNATMKTLEQGLTPIAIEDHILILGWTNRTPAIVKELLLSEERVQRFLRRRGTRRLRIVILAEEVDARLMHDLRAQLGLGRGVRDARRIILRSGSSLRLEHLHRVAHHRAAVVLLPGADFAMGGAERSDARVVKTLISLAPAGRDTFDPADAPAVVAEVFDAQKIPIAEKAYAGQIDVLAGDATISHLIAQNVRHRGLSYLYAELLSYHHGNEFYIRPAEAFAGRTYGGLHRAFSGAVLVGVVRPDGRRFAPHLSPPPDFVVQHDDRLVVMAPTYAASAPVADGLEMPLDGPPPPPDTPRAQPRRRILCMGWSHKVPALLRAFAGYPQERFQVDLLSVVPAAERAAALTAAGFDAAGSHVRVRHLEGNYTLRAELEAHQPADYDNVVFLASDWMDNTEETDARTILGYTLLRALLPGHRHDPEILVELLDPENARLFSERAGEVIISPVILSHMMAHVALRRELSAVFAELFGPSGAEVFFRRAADYGLTASEVRFRDLQRAALRRRETALGLRLRDEREAPHGGVYLNPDPTRRWTLAPDDELVVLTAAPDEEEEEEDERV